MSLKDDELPYCTDDERWMRDSLYKVYKLDPDGKFGGKARRSSRSLFDCEDWVEEKESQEQAKSLADNASKKKPKPEEDVLAGLSKYIIQEIKPSPTKCGLCEISSFCNQRIQEIENNQHEENLEEDEL